LGAIRGSRSLVASQGLCLGHDSSLNESDQMNLFLSRSDMCTDLVPSGSKMNVFYPSERNINLNNNNDKSQIKRGSSKKISIDDLTLKA
ncbi:hypothetical protein HAX54_014978, partial [Datura stramonium]|nr:hypothetical protein [Datura stramonium]